MNEEREENGNSPKREISDSTQHLELFDEEGLNDEQIFVSRVFRGLRKGARYSDPSCPDQPQTHVPKVLLRSLEEEKRQMSEKMPLNPWTRKEYIECAYFRFSTPHNGLLFKGEKTVQMKDYAPKVFADIRKLCGVTVDFYANGWDFDKSEVTLPSLGPGRSGSLFLTAKNKGFLFKTIPSFEVVTLCEILPYLHQHYSEHPESRIIRFLGLHRFHNLKGEKIYAVVMNNLLFHPDYGIDVKYDLKGRIPKPGKEGRLGASSTGPLTSRPGLVIKDNDLLDRKFYPKNRDELMQTLADDVNFLSKHNCMDYSLLVGIHWLRDDEDQNASTTENKKKKKKRSEITRSRAKSVAKEVEVKEIKGSKKKKKNGKEPRRSSAELLRESAPPTANGKKKKSKPSDESKGSSTSSSSAAAPIPHVYLRAIPSDEGHNEMYFIGIIDPLSRYGVRKKVAHLLKRSMWKDQELSTVPADYYAERYITYLKKIFPEQKKAEDEKKKKKKKKQEKEEKKESED